jgi:hypothetical protein
MAEDGGFTSDSLPLGEHSSASEKVTAPTLSERVLALFQQLQQPVFRYLLRKTRNAGTGPRGLDRHAVTIPCFQCRSLSQLVQSLQLLPLSCSSVEIRPFLKTKQLERSLKSSKFVSRKACLLKLRSPRTNPFT